MPVTRSHSASKQVMPFSPECNPDLNVGLRKARLSDILARQDWFSTVSYRQETEEGTIVTERTFPMGELRRRTVMLVLDYWDVYLDEEQQQLAPITEKNLDLLDPSEFNEIYDEILRMNPEWGGEQGKSTSDE